MLRNVTDLSGAFLLQAQFKITTHNSFGDFKTATWLLVCNIQTFNQNLEAFRNFSFVSFTRLGSPSDSLLSLKVWREEMGGGCWVAQLWFSWLAQHPYTLGLGTSLEICNQLFSRLFAKCCRSFSHFSISPPSWWSHTKPCLTPLGKHPICLVPPNNTCIQFSGGGYFFFCLKIGNSPLIIRIWRLVRQVPEQFLWYFQQSNIAKLIAGGCLAFKIAPSKTALGHLWCNIFLLKAFHFLYAKL